MIAWPPALYNSELNRLTHVSIGQNPDIAKTRLQTHKAVTLFNIVAFRLYNRRIRSAALLPSAIYLGYIIS